MIRVKLGEIRYCIPKELALAKIEEVVEDYFRGRLSKFVGKWKWTKSKDGCCWRSQPVNLGDVVVDFEYDVDKSNVSVSYGGDEMIVHLGYITKDDSGDQFVHYNDRAFSEWIRFIAGHNDRLKHTPSSSFTIRNAYLAAVDEADDKGNWFTRFLRKVRLRFKVFDGEK